jgi:hypothetical protein
MSWLQPLEILGPEALSCSSEYQHSLGMMDLGGSQHVETARCRNLYVAILNVVVEDLKGDGVTTLAGVARDEQKAKLQREALDFLQSEDFVDICEILDLDPGIMRKEMKKQCCFKLPSRGQTEIRVSTQSLPELMIPAGA